MNDDDFKLLSGFADKCTDGQTDICDCRVAFETKNLFGTHFRSLSKPSMEGINSCQCIIMHIIFQSAYNQIANNRKQAKKLISWEMKDEQ